LVDGFADGGSGAAFDVVVPAEFAVGLAGVVVEDDLLCVSLVPFSGGATDAEQVFFGGD
jgi:hypothetical protein